MAGANGLSAAGMATDRIDNDGIPSTVKVLPEWQRLKVGDTVPIWRNLDFPVVALGRYPVDRSHVRLVWRIRVDPYNRGPYNWAILLPSGWASLL
jgi:hypothetical protein